MAGSAAQKEVALARGVPVEHSGFSDHMSSQLEDWTRLVSSRLHALGPHMLTHVAFSNRQLNAVPCLTTATLPGVLSCMSRACLEITPASSGSNTRTCRSGSDLRCFQLVFLKINFLMVHRLSLVICLVERNGKLINRRFRVNLSYGSGPPPRSGVFCLKFGASALHQLSSRISVLFCGDLRSQTELHTFIRTASLRGNGWQKDVSPKKHSATPQK